MMIVAMARLLRGSAARRQELGDCFKREVSSGARRGVIEGGACVWQQRQHGKVAACDEI